MRIITSITVLSLAVALAGCGRSETTDSTTPDKPKAEKTATYKLGQRVDNVAFIAMFDDEGYASVSGGEYIYLSPRAARVACGSDEVVDIRPLTTGAGSYFSGATVICAPRSDR